MGLPWIQMGSEVIEHGAADLAVMLDWDEAHAGWALLKIFDWALKRADPAKPPSQSSDIMGPFAARMVARAGGWQGDPDTFIKACAMLPDPPVTLVDNGVRIHGLKRYDSAWAKNHRPKPDRRAAAPEPTPIRPEAGAEPSRNTPGSAPEDRDRDVDREKRKEAAAAARKNVPAIPEKPDTPDELWTEDTFVDWMQAKRFHEEGLPVDTKARRTGVKDLLRTAMMEGFELPDIRNGFVAYGNDPYWKKQGIPINGFVSQWRQYVRKAVNDAL